MNFLLDTHVLLWAVLDDPRLKPSIHAVLADGESTAWVSLASLWEIGIKISQGKLRLPGNHLDSVLEQMQRWRVATLPVELEHVRMAATLPFHHSDPFDRMLIAQAKVEDMTLLFADDKFRQYDVRVSW